MVSIEDFDISLVLFNKLHRIRREGAERKDNMVVIVTGASGGIGSATVREFVDGGATVVACDVTQPDNDVATVSRSLDVQSGEGWKILVKETFEKYGRIDVVVNNAAIFVPSTIIDTSEEDFDRTLAVNLTGPFLGMKYAGAVMAEQGSGLFINISSTAGVRGYNAHGAYAASKAGLIGMSRVAALEMGLRGVRVVCICPGATDAPFANPAGMTPAELTSHPLSVRQPIRRFGKPSEVAQLCTFLASDAAAYITGTEIVIDGGMTIGGYMAGLPGAPSPV